ncbi:phage tail spike protein [Clostridium paraputrificum]|uniref:phage tail spike protein n=1 Tax=Clostridium paraputrificum TaxID=29363 RepID=UPI000C06D624|nr:phage tail spike protein [Clostridium paraputrificum]
MIEIYLKTNTNYEMNGDIILTPISCTYKAIEYLVTLEHPIDDIGRWKYIDYENVISVENDGKKKLYRIFNIVKSLYSVTAYARPLFFDLIDNVLLDVRPTLKNGEEALNIILEGTGFTGHSNISNINTSYYVRKNIVEAILGNDENSFLNRWGGEVLLDNFDIYINDKIGSDNGVRVEFGYNLNEIEEDINIEEVATRIIPTGYNGIMLDGSTPWVDSPLINKYTKPKMRVINFDDVKVKESETDEEGFNTIEEARQELIKRCNKLYEEGIDKPSVNYKIDMINLANTTAYKDYIKLVTVNEGDTVTCYIPGLDIDVKARVIDYEEDLITGEYISLELGNVQNNFFNNQADLQNRVDSILNSNGTVKADMLNGAINALNTKFKAQRDVAQPQQVRAMLFEDRVEGSPTFGCMCIGTMGFEIADSFKPGTEEWDFRTFGTGMGFVADCIVAGTLRAIVLESMDGSCRIDLGNGIVNITKGIIKGLNSEWNLNTGTFRTEKVEPYGTYSIEIGAGRIYSGNLLDVRADNGMNFSADNFAWFKRDGGGSIMSLGVENRRFDVVMDRIYLVSDRNTSIDIEEGDIKLYGNVFINGISYNSVLSSLTNLEIQAMQSEGII